MALVLPLPHLLVVQTANRFQELPGVVVVPHPLPDDRLPGLGHEELTQAAGVGEHQIQAGVEFPAGAAAVGLATDPPPLEQVAAQQAALTGELGELGPGVPLRGRHRAPWNPFLL